VMFGKLLVGLVCLLGCKGQVIAEISVEYNGTIYPFRGIYGTFGPVESLGFSRLVDIEKENACEPLSALNRTEPWIAITQRGGCTFHEKIINVYNAGGAAVLIANTNPNEVVIMGDKDAVPIVAASVSGNTGFKLRYFARGSAYVSIEVGEDLRVLRFGISKVFFDIALFLIVFCAVVSLIAMLVFFRRRSQHNDLADIQQTHQDTSKLEAQNAIERLPILHYRQTPCGLGCGLLEGLTVDGAERVSGCAGDLEEEGITACAICLESFVDNEELRALPCGHGNFYHRQCIDPWLIERRTCPLCKRNFMGKPSEDFDCGRDATNSSSSTEDGGNNDSDDDAFDRSVGRAALHPHTPGYSRVNGNSDQENSSDAVVCVINVPEGKEEEDDTEAEEDHEEDQESKQLLPRSAHDKV